MFKVIEHKSKSVRWWYEQQDSIDLDPSYQRQGSLWGLPKKQRLIDSILNGYDIPKIYLADFTYRETKLNEKEKLYAVIDGKQRLEALFQFLSGKFRTADDFEYFENPRLRLANLRGPEIRQKHPEIWEAFKNYKLSVVSVITDNEKRINDMFVRLNSGLSVNGAERRNAMPGIIPVLIRHMVAHPFFKQKISFDTKRMQQYNLAAKLLLIEHRGEFVDTKAKNLDHFVIEGERGEQEKFETTNKKVLKILDAITDQFTDHDPSLSRSGEIPVYYRLIRRNFAQVRYVCKFIRNFAPTLMDNFQLSKISPNQSDRELDKYYTQSRTSNDRGSMEARYKLLRRKLRKNKAVTS